MLRSATSDLTWELEPFVAGFYDGNLPPLQPFATESMQFCSALSKRLFATPDIRQHPEIVALAYWLRPGPIESARTDYKRHETANTILCPRGRVFHIPPANVDTIFVYSWVLSLLVGNINVIRLSERTSSVLELLTDAISDILAEPQFEVIAERNRFVFSGHDDAISAGLSRLSDLRVVWGGDATVEHFRRFPLPARGRELTFPNRHSIALLSAERVALVDADGLANMADRFFNDAYWFDQAGCASPRLLIWYSQTGEHVNEARRRFHEAVLDSIDRRGYQAEIGTAIQKRVYGFHRVTELSDAHYEAPSNEVTWIQLSNLSEHRREHCGGGLFFEYVSKDLEADLLGFVTAEDQTASYYGIEVTAIHALARRLNGCGIDRFVPLGSALDFDRIWDGLDLLQEFSRRVRIDSDGPPSDTEPS